MEGGATERAAVQAAAEDLREGDDEQPEAPGQEAAAEEAKGGFTCAAAAGGAGLSANDVSAGAGARKRPRTGGGVQLQATVQHTQGTHG